MTTMLDGETHDAIKEKWAIDDEEEISVSQRLRVTGKERAVGSEKGDYQVTRTKEEDFFFLHDVPVKPGKEDNSGMSSKTAEGREKHKLKRKTQKLFGELMYEQGRGSVLFAPGPLFVYERLTGGTAQDLTAALNRLEVEAALNWLKGKKEVSAGEKCTDASIMNAHTY